MNDYYGDLHKHRLSADGEDLGVETWYEKTQSRNEVKKRALEEFRAKQGCRMEGFMEMNRVPGYFYISTQDFSDILYDMQHAHGFH